MEQVKIFLTQYVSWIYAGIGILALILLICILHRIKRAERNIFLQNREIKRQLELLLFEKEKNKKEKILEQEKKAVQAKGTGNEEPITLIHDVLEEIFP